MTGSTLGDIRQYVESLASDAGTYYLACARTGVRPAPADWVTFDTRATARAAARATEQYRDALRRYDPQLPYYDVIVRERPGGDFDGDRLDGTARRPVRPSTGGHDGADGPASSPSGT